MRGWAWCWPCPPRRSPPSPGAAPTSAGWRANAGYGETMPPPDRLTSLVAGPARNCGVKTDANLVCWGYNGSHQNDAPPGPFSGVAVGLEHTCGLAPDGTVSCWGNRGQGQDRAPAEPLAGIVAGYFHTVSYTHLRAHETGRNLVCRLLL